MARPLRITFPGAVYHVTSRGNERKAIYDDDRDREAFLDILHRVSDRYNWLCHGYCLMDNHYHLLIETPDGNLSIGMRQLNGVYTQLFNRRHSRVGHLQQRRKDTTSQNPPMNSKLVSSVSVGSNWMRSRIGSRITTPTF